jgi:hypothetical protein
MAGRVKVKALKAFPSEGEIVGPGMVEVPAERVERLAEKGLIEAPAAGAQAAPDSGKIEGVAARIEKATEIARKPKESAEAYLERAAWVIEEQSSRSKKNGGVNGEDALPPSFPSVARLKEIGVTTFAQLGAKADTDLGKAGFKDDEVKGIRAAEKNRVK